MILLLFKAQAGLLSTVHALEFARSYINEDNVAVWRDLITNLSHLSSLLVTTEFNENFSSYMRSLIRPAFNKLGWNPIPSESCLKINCLLFAKLLNNQ